MAKFLSKEIRISNIQNIKTDSHPLKKISISRILWLFWILFLGAIQIMHHTWGGGGAQQCHQMTQGGEGHLKK
jgi:hypothetical protein